VESSERFESLVNCTSHLLVPERDALGIGPAELARAPKQKFEADEPLTLPKRAIAALVPRLWQVCRPKIRLSNHVAQLIT
jgi:hypothetical protein